MSVNNIKFVENIIIKNFYLTPVLTCLRAAEAKFSMSVQSFFKPITRHPNPENFRVSQAIGCIYLAYLTTSHIDKYLKLIGLHFISMYDFDYMSRSLLYAPYKIFNSIYKFGYQSLITSQTTSVAKESIRATIASFDDLIKDLSEKTLTEKSVLVNNTIVQTISNTTQILSNVVSKSIDATKFSFFSQCAVPTLEQANMCIPYMESPISVIPHSLPTISKVIQFSNESFFSVLPEVCPVDTLTNTTISIPTTILPVEQVVTSSVASSFYPVLGTMLSAAFVCYSIYKMYQYYYTKPIIENPAPIQTLPPKEIINKPVEIKVEEKQIDEIKDLKNASQILSNDSFFIKRYFVTTAIFGKATFYNAVRTTVYLTLMIFSLPGVMSQKGRTFFKKKFFQSILHFNATLASAVGTIFPYAGRKIFQSQMRLIYPSLYKKIS